MIAILTGALVLVLLVCIVRWLAAVPLTRTLSASIDCWADGLQGKEAGDAG